MENIIAPAVMMWFIGLMSLLQAVVMAVWIITIVDVVRRQFYVESDRIAWILVVVLTGIIGVIIYWAFGRQKGYAPNTPPPPAPYPPPPR